MRITIMIPAIFFFFQALSCGHPTTGRGINVLLVIIDTLRADHLGPWGYPRNLTPTLDSLAEEGTVWINAQSHSSWTLPSVTSILTGLYPRQHGAGAASGNLFAMPPTIRTLPALLHSRGWKTCGIFNVVFLSEDFGFHRGFDHFDCKGITGNRGTRKAGETVDAFVKWLEEYRGDEPFMAVLHFYDPHIPYDPPPPYDTMFADVTPEDLYSPEYQTDIMFAVNRSASEISVDGLDYLSAMYDGEIAYTDSQLARLFAYMRTDGFMNNTLVVVVADHGEEFMEHSGLGHGSTLYQEVLHVPVILSGPGVPAGVIIEEPCALVDVFPTVISILGLDCPPDRPGRNLLSDDRESVDIPSSNLLWSNVLQAAVRRGEKKIIWYPGGRDPEMYDLELDPLESDPLEEVDSSLVRAAEYYWATPSLGEPVEVRMDDAAKNQLRDLGYIR